MAEWSAQGKTFVITGGASGLGAAYVEDFLKEGAKKIAILDVAEEVGKALSKRLNETYDNRTIFLTCDVSKEDNISKAFEKLLEKLEKIDVFINNAGILNDAEHIWRKSCDVNWQGLASFTRKAVKHMRKDEGGAGGTIVNVSSIAGFLKFSIAPAYGGSKAAVLHFSLSLAEPPFYNKTGVRILTICFGPTRTPLMRDLPEKSIDKEVATAMTQAFPFEAYQSVDSAVAAMRTMFKVGTNGSVWLAVKDRPVQDVTDAINSAYKIFEDIVYN